MRTVEQGGAQHVGRKQYAIGFLKQREQEIQMAIHAAQHGTARARAGTGTRGHDTAQHDVSFVPCHIGPRAGAAAQAQPWPSMPCWQARRTSGLRAGPSACCGRGGGDERVAPSTGKGEGEERVAPPAGERRRGGRSCDAGLLRPWRNAYRAGGAAPLPAVEEAERGGRGGGRRARGVGETGRGSHGGGR